MKEPIVKSSGNVFFDLGFPPEEVANLQIAAAKLLDMRKKFKVKKRGYKTLVSENIKEHLYVAEGKD